MKISDELREWADVHCGEECEEYLGLLADRIDREMIELPKDVHGVPINIGDTIYAADGSTANVFGIYIMQYKKNVVCMLSNGGSIVCAPYELSHEQPDSLERIADELDEQAGSLTKDGYTWQDDAIHELADRIRKLADKEG